MNRDSPGGCLGLGQIKQLRGAAPRQTSDVRNLRQLGCNPRGDNTPFGVAHHQGSGSVDARKSPGGNTCRAEAWRAGIDRLRSMVPKALDALANELNRADNPDRCKIALDILRLAKLADISPQGPEEPETIVRLAVNRERQQARDPLDDLTEDHKGLPAYDEHLARKWDELEAKAAGG